MTEEQRSYDDHNRLINLAQRMEQVEVQLNALTEQSRKEAVLCPFSPERGSNGNTLVDKVVHLEAEVATSKLEILKLKWYIALLAVTNVAALGSQWWPLLSKVLLVP